MHWFYNTFFQKNSFLSYDKNSFYSDTEYLRSKGFRDEDNYRNKTVLELGAGTGRLTANIIELGLISNVGKYIVVEPTDGIKEIERLCSGNAAFKFIQTDLDGLKGILEERSIDLFIAHGVIPHIENAGGLDHIIKEMEIFLKEDGTLHIVNSFFGHPKKIANALKRRTSGNTVLSYLAAFFPISLQYLMCNRIVNQRPSYILNFIFSHQPGLMHKVLHQYEFYMVHPYIHYSFSDFKKSCKNSGLYINEVFPHCIAFTASREQREVGIEKAIASGKEVIFYGDDWHSQWVCDTFPDVRGKVGDRPREITENHTIIISYDYTNKTSYHHISDKLEGNGLLFGENLFTYHYLF